MKKFITKIYRRLFPELIVRYLIKELQGCNVVLDLGCGWNSPIRGIPLSYSLGVEIFKNYILESQQKNIHSDYIIADINKIQFNENSFDVVLILDVIEHLTKEDGILLLEKSARWAKKKVIVFTPNGYVLQKKYDSNILQEHLSGWSVDDLSNLGFKVKGVNGWIKLRGHKAIPRYKPMIFWVLISDLTQIITYHLPKIAFQLFAVKTLN